MATSVPVDTLKTTERFYTVVKSLCEFDEIEVRGVVRTLLSTTARERCFIATYYRAVSQYGDASRIEKPQALPSDCPCWHAAYLSWPSILD